MHGSLNCLYALIWSCFIGQKSLTQLADPVNMSQVQYIFIIQWEDINMSTRFRQCRSSCAIPGTRDGSVQGKPCSMGTESKGRYAQQE